MLRKLISSLFTISLLLGLSNSVLAQSDYSSDLMEKQSKRTYSGAIKADPINLIFSEFALSYEGALSRQNSIVIISGLTLANSSNIYGGKNVFGYKTQFQFRRYVTGPNILNGLYLGPYAYYRKIKIDRYRSVLDPTWGILAEEQFRGNAYTLGTGVLVGYQAILGNTITMDFFLGSGLKYSKDNVGVSYYYTNWGYTNESTGVFGFRSSGISAYGGFTFGIVI